jgi:hypothetical protein
VSRDARTGPARDRDARAGGRRSGAASRNGTVPGASPRPGRAGEAGQSSPRRSAGTAAAAPTGAPADGLVVGAVPPLARLAGAVLVLAAVVAVAALFPTYLVVDGQSLSSAAGFAGVVVALAVPLVHLAVGGGLVRGAVPKFGLAYAATTGALALGQLLIEI